MCLFAGGTVCSVCGRCYMNAISLKHHMAQHRGLTTCPICGHVSSRIGNLRVHLRRVHLLMHEQIEFLVPRKVPLRPRADSQPDATLWTLIFLAPYFPLHIYQLGVVYFIGGFITISFCPSQRCFTNTINVLQFVFHYEMSRYFCFIWIRFSKKRCSFTVLLGIGRSEDST